MIRKTAAWLKNAVNEIFYKKFAITEDKCPQVSASLINDNFD